MYLIRPIPVLHLRYHEKTQDFNMNKVINNMLVTKNLNQLAGRFSVILFLAFSGIVPAFAQGDSTAAAGGGQAGGAAPAGGAPDAAAMEKGKTLFSNYCQQCHAVTKEVVLGPGLSGILQRRDEAWLLPWIKNSQKVIQSGDKYAVDLYNKYNQAQMPSFENLSDDDVKGILAYVQSAGSGGGQAASTSKGVGEQVADQTGVGDGSGGGGGISSQYFTIILGALLVILLLVLLVLILIVSLLGKFLNNRGNLSEEDKEVVTQKSNLGKIVNSPAFKSGIGMIFFLIVGKVALDRVMDIGVTQGYAPTQPIAYSHKLHAGQYKINCAYCHTTVYKGKTASIPSANICMNCHNAIKQNSPEIKKLYAAIENDRPIEWVRVHNLPDLAYFNHAQHTNVGGVECQNCHGEIEKMEVVQQVSPLTMGWCIDCHRQTNVNSEGNAYYDKLLAVHNSKEPMKVVNIGGIECSKCHY